MNVSLAWSLWESSSSVREEVNECSLCESSRSGERGGY